MEINHMNMLIFLDGMLFFDMNICQQKHVFLI